MPPAGRPPWVEPVAVFRLTALIIGGVIRVVAALGVVAVLGAGVPLLWVWVGSQLQGGTAPSLAGLGAALGGIIASYAALGVLFSWLKQRSEGSTGPVRYGWNRSLTEARREPGSTTHPLEDIVAVATILVGIVASVWFFLFGDPGVPVVP